jgi:hypothetical protein
VEEMRRRPHWIGIGVMKQRKPDTKCEFTLRAATLNSRSVVSRQENAPTSPAFDGDRAHATPPTRPPRAGYFLLCFVRVQ